MTDNVTVLYSRQKVIKFNDYISIIVSTVNYIHCQHLNNCMFQGYMGEADAV
jgi:hypothetical protein